MSLLGTASEVRAETLDGALTRAYIGNPPLGSQRASLRAVDETVPRALAGYRPRVNATASLGYSNVSGSSSGSSISRSTVPRSVGLQIDQTLFNGLQTFNSVRQAESQILGSRETLRNTEQSVLYNGAVAYMNVLRDTAALDLQRNNVEVLEEQLRQTRDRFSVGEVTRTDVAQAESRLALARSQVSLAESNLQASIATYRQNIGVQPSRLAPGRPVDRLVPRSSMASVEIGLAEHPAILSALHAVDVAEFQVKILEGQLLPTLTLSGATSQSNDQQTSGDNFLSASVTGRLTVPIYQGGSEYAVIRQAKETVDQRRIEAESTRDAVRAQIITAYGTLDAAKAQVTATQAQVEAAETALAGVREEARVGQRTTLDVLNAQQELLNARVNLINAQRDRVVTSYSVVQSTGRLTAKILGLRTEQYSARTHFDQVKDLWWGLRTPDGR